MFGAQHKAETSVRAGGLSSTDGLERGSEITDTGSPIDCVPIGKETSGRMFNVVGQPIDGKDEFKSSCSIHQNPPALSDQSARAELLETGIK